MTSRTCCSDVSMQSSEGPDQDLKADSEVDGGTCEDSQQRSEQPADVPKSFTENSNNPELVE